MKKINKSTLSAILIIFGFFVMSLNFGDNPAISQPIFTEDFETNESLPNMSQFIPRNIRIAIYDEPNVTNPSYSIGNTLTNNFTALILLLESAGFGVTKLTCDDIYNHKLMTADYDVFIMVDNLPKFNITDYVKEFWLGGGGVLSFDSALAYLCWAGIIIPESVDDGRGTYWGYFPGTTHNISMRHPITKEYQINDKFSSAGIGITAFDWNVVPGTSVGSEIVKLANREGNNDQVTAVALHRSDKGGPIVHLPGRGDKIGINMSDLIIDSVEWLCPRPKGRILFDLSHQPFYGVDAWDSPYADWGDRYYLWRDNLVNRSYTFDKLYPSATGNLTSNNLAPYDMLILCNPMINYTANEISSVMNWVNNGGGLFILGGYYSVRSQKINDLLSSTGLNVNLTNSGSDGIVDYKVEHPTVEGCAELDCTNPLPSLIRYTGNAIPIWGESSNSIVIGGQEYGNGRIMLSGDMFFLRYDHLELQNNLQFGINVANWLTASQAKVLVYIREYITIYPNDNIYKGPVATALNDLGIPFHLTFDINYFNYSLNTGAFKLAIFEQHTGLVDSYFSDILEYMKSGGSLIISTWQYAYSTGDDLWNYLGFEYAGDEFTLPQDLYIWDTAHPIFNHPANYGTTTLNTTLNLVTIDMLNVTLHSNATAIAGLTSTSSNDGAAIILGAGGRAITNTMQLTAYYDDTDDSTYPDALEIWENEIAFMMYQSLSVGISSPHTSDIFNATAPDFIITTDGIGLDDTWYTLNSGAEYHISSKSGKLNPSAWDGLPDGDVSLRFYVEDTADNSKYTTVNIVKDSQGPNITIISPSAIDTFGATALSFIVEIVDEHLDKMWYTLNSGSTKYFFTANGSIDQSVWDTLADGTITIRFYANDTVSNEAFATVSVEISTSGNGGGGGIPGFNSYILIGVIFVISTLIVKRQLKQNKFKN